MPLTVHAPFEPAGDQPAAIVKLVEGLGDGLRYQTLLGVTASGKTHTMARVIERMQRPALVMAPNKILAAQLASEFREFFPEAAVEYFVSYYDYYQPEAYVPARDLFIEKDANVNQELERLRHSATRSLLTRRDTIIVASVSCIYGLGAPDEYRRKNLLLAPGMRVNRDELLARLVSMQYERNDTELRPGAFSARGDVIDVWGAHDEQPIRVDLWGDEIDGLSMVHPVTKDPITTLEGTTVFPASHYMMPEESLDEITANIEADLDERIAFFEKNGKLVEAQRLRERTRYDLEMLRTLGTCKGIENYSRYLDGRGPGDTPYTLMDYLPDDTLLFLDESHQMVPQISGMYNGDLARKSTLVEYGFRLPAAIDNRPLKLNEFFGKVNQAVFVSATPADAERERSDQVVEQVVRPTGLVDPQITVKSTRGQVDDLMYAARQRAEAGERVLITTLTKKMAEDLTEYLANQGIRVRYMHSDIDAVERQEIIRDLRLGRFDVLVGINLLREGLDLPEVSLVCILDADKTGFLRNPRSMIQTIGRAARNVHGEVYMYADTVTDAMRAAIDETDRRRDKQIAFNEEHGITPQTIQKAVRGVLRYGPEKDDATVAAPAKLDDGTRDELLRHRGILEQQMYVASAELAFETAATLRDRIREIDAVLDGQVEEIDLSRFEGLEDLFASAVSRA
ncbi:MAG: excinuclease ABC subunit UvrB [Trueperaceae bacterium]|nr:excinuclease ABC subunit UvrB [Trueperaceae bacterium]